MKGGLGYFIAAALGVVATCLNLYNDGPNLKSGNGVIFIVAMLILGFRAQPAGRQP